MLLKAIIQVLFGERNAINSNYTSTYIEERNAFTSNYTSTRRGNVILLLGLHVKAMLLAAIMRVP